MKTSEFLKSVIDKVAVSIGLLFLQFIVLPAEVFDKSYTLLCF